MLKTSLLISHTVQFICFALRASMIARGHPFQDPPRRFTCLGYQIDEEKYAKVIQFESNKISNIRTLDSSWSEYVSKTRIKTSGRRDKTTTKKNSAQQAAEEEMM